MVSASSSETSVSSSTPTTAIIYDAHTYIIIIKKKKKINNKENDCSAIKETFQKISKKVSASFIIFVQAKYSTAIHGYLLFFNLLHFTMWAKA